MISELKALRAMTSRIAKEYASSCKKADHVADIKTLTEEGFAKLENIYQTSVSISSVVCVYPLIYNSIERIESTH